MYDYLSQLLDLQVFTAQNQDCSSALIVTLL